MPGQVSTGWPSTYYDTRTVHICREYASQQLPGASTHQLPLVRYSCQSTCTLKVVASVHATPSHNEALQAPQTCGWLGTNASTPGCVCYLAGPVLAVRALAPWRVLNPHEALQVPLPAAPPDKQPVTSSISAALVVCFAGLSPAARAHVPWRLMRQCTTY